MFRHFLTIERIANELHDIVVGRQLTEAWTQHAGEVILRWSTDSERTPAIQPDLFVVIHITSNASITIEQQLHRQRRNATDVLHTVRGQRCHAVVKIDGDRIITFVMDTARMHILLFSGGSANVVVEDGGNVVDAFRKKQSLIGTRFIVSSADEPLGKLLDEEQRFHATPVTDLIRVEPYSYVLERNHEITIGLLPLHGWKVLERYPSVLQALKRATILRHQRERFTTRLLQIRTAIEREQGKLQRALSNMLSDRAQADHASTYRAMADILMSQPDIHQSHGTSLTATAIDGTLLTIPLKPDQTLLEAAQALYAKAKRSERSAQSLQQRIPVAQHRLIELSTLQDQLSGCLTHDDLDLLFPPTKPLHAQRSSETVFREFDLAEGWRMYVGRNAVNNDQLTLKFAKPNDLWFHARGVSGSHCILRKGRGTSTSPPPPIVLEQAASIAAYYSSARNATWTPVMYTLRKYVRKVKGSAPGAVHVDRETVIMAEPRLPNDRKQ